jgi:hypothetical protein
MALADFVVKKTTINFDGGSFTLRGINFSDITAVLLDRQEDVEKALELYKAGDPNDPAHQQMFLGDMLATLPVLVAKLVANCAGEPEHWDKFLEMPIPTQAEALVALADLTLTEPDSLKKFNAHVAHLVGKMTKKSLT